jgi:hypothetical protein
MADALDVLDLVERQVQILQIDKVLKPVYMRNPVIVEIQVQQGVGQRGERLDIGYAVLAQT